MQRYECKSDDPKTNAQRNLMGRTHYVDPDTLRYHRSRVLSAKATDNGLLFAIVTSDSLDYNHTRRGFRYVIFDIFGTVLARVNLEDAFTSQAAAKRAMWQKLETINAVEATQHAIVSCRTWQNEELDRLAASLTETVNA